MIENPNKTNFLEYEKNLKSLISENKLNKTAVELQSLERYLDLVQNLLETVSFEPKYLNFKNLSKDIEDYLEYSEKSLGALNLSSDLDNLGLDLNTKDLSSLNLNPQNLDPEVLGNLLDTIKKLTKTNKSGKFNPLAGGIAGELSELTQFSNNDLLTKAAEELKKNPDLIKNLLPEIILAQSSDTKAAALKDSQNTTIVVIIIVICLLCVVLVIAIVFFIKTRSVRSNEVNYDTRSVRTIDTIGGRDDSFSERSISGARRM